MPAKQRNHKIYLLSAIFGAAAGGLSIPFFSFLIWFLQLPVSFSGTFSLMAFGFGCLISGVSAGILKRRNGILNGVRAALILLLVLIIIAFLLGNLSGELILGRLVTAVLCGSVGGVIGVNRK
ncbi:MAG: TIGR04086 family membrane protein [Oscillospiraceae bacterium]|nr:TIGR04086 family membrane protein [Oscillospiraceae bacterium]